MFGILFCFVQVLIQNAISFPCNDCILAYIPLEELIGPSPTLIVNDTSVSLTTAGQLSFNGPLKARGKITILGGSGGGFRPFCSPFRNPFFIYPQIYLPTLPTVLPLPILGPISVFLNSSLNIESDVPFEALATVTPEDIEPTDDSSDLPMEDNSEVTSSNEDSNEQSDSDNSNKESDSNEATVTTEATLESTESDDTDEDRPRVIIKFDPVSKIPIVDFENVIPDGDCIAKHIEAPLTDVEAKIEELVAKVMSIDTVVDAPIEIDADSSETDENELPIAGTVEFNGLVPASGCIKIFGHF